MSSPSFPVSGSGSSGEGTSDHSLLTNRDSADQHPAASVTPVTTNFDGNLSSADDTVQKALETLDASVVAKSLFDANTIIKADSDNTPAALTVGEQTIVGRITSGVIAALSATQVRTLLNVADGANAYSLPTAAADTLGGIKVGTRLSIADGVLSADEQAGGATDHWIAESGSFAATPASTSTLTMTSDKTGTIKPGYGVRYTIGGTAYYGVITAMASNLMTIAGASLSGDVTALAYTKTGVIQMPILIPGYYEDATSAALLAEDLGQTLIWQQGPAYMVRALMYSRVVDSSSDGYANIRQGAAVATGTAQAGAATTVTLAAGASGDDDTYNNMWIKITGGTGIGQSRKITDYVGSTKVATVATWVTNPTSDSTYEIYKPIINSNTYSGLVLDSTAAKTTVVDIDTAKYAIAYGDSISVMALKGTGGTAQDLSVMLTYVVA